MLLCLGRALFIFFRDAYFKQGIVVIKESAYPCMRGQLITNHKELTLELKINTRDWERYFKDLKEENVIQVERQLLEYQLKRSEAVAEYNTRVAGIDKLLSRSSFE